MTPRRSPRCTASVRVDTPSLPKIDARWNFTVCSLIASALRDVAIGQAVRDEREHVVLARRQ